MTATYSDATFVGLGDRFDDVLAEPPDRGDLVTRALLTSAITMSPSDLPAVELPYYEPTTDDLAAIELRASDDEINARIEAANTRSAFEARLRDLPRAS